MKLKTNNTSVFTIPEMDRTIVLETRTLVKTSKPAQWRNDCLAKPCNWLRRARVGMVFAKIDIIWTYGFYQPEVK